MPSLYDICDTGTPLEQLIQLRRTLAKAIDECTSKRDLAALSRQYRDVNREISDLQSNEAPDEIEEILARRRENGEPGAVRRDVRWKNQTM